MNSIMSLLQPQISSLSSQYGQIAKSNEEFAPRGGGRTAALQEQPFNEANQISTLVSGERNFAATEAAQLGLGELGASTSAAATGLQGTALQTQQADQAQQQQQQAGQSIGALLGLLVGA
jgi:hypothetical protein